MSYDPAYPAGGDDIEDGSLTRDDFAPAAGMPVVRRGAYFGPEGERHYVEAPNSVRTAEGFTVRWKMALLPPSDARAIWWGGATGRWGFVVAPAGAQLIENTGNIVHAYDPNVVVTDGAPHSYEVAVTASTYSISVDGVERASGSHSQPLSGQNAVRYIGGALSNVYESHDVTIWDFECENETDAASSFFYALDTVDSSNRYPNTRTGSTKGDAGFIGTVIPVTIAATTPGSGVPVSEGPVVVSLKQTAVQSASGADATLTSFVEFVDPYGWAAFSGITIPVAGTGTFTTTGRIRVTAVSGSDDLQIAVRNGGATLGSQDITFDTVNEWKPFAITFADDAVTSSYSINMRVANVAATTDWEVDDVTLTLTLYPDLS